MEIPVMNMITESVGGLNVNILSQIFSSISPALHFWKWSAVILALLATFSGVINRIKILITKSRRKTSPVSGSFCRRDSENDASVSDHLRSPICSSFRDEVEPPGMVSDFRVKGSGHHRDSGLRRRHCAGEVDRDSFSWPYFRSGESVVKEWENIRLGCEFDEFYGPEICSIFGGKAQIPPVTVLFAGKGISGNVSLRHWDTRVRRWAPGSVVDVYSGDSMAVEVPVVMKNLTAAVTVDGRPTPLLFCERN